MRRMLRIKSLLKRKKYFYQCLILKKPNIKSISIVYQFRFKVIEIDQEKKAVISSQAEQWLYFLNFCICVLTIYIVTI